MLWVGAIAFFVAGACVGALIGVRYGFADGYLRGLRKQITVDDFLDVLDHAAHEAGVADGPPERPEVTH